MQRIELSESAWMEKTGKGLEVVFQLSGIAIHDSREKLEFILNQKGVEYRVEQPFEAEMQKKQYFCEGCRYNVIDDNVVGLALEYLHIGRDYIENHLGAPDDTTILLGQVYSMYDFEIDGYIWEYKKLNLKITFDVEQEFARTFNIGKTLYFLDSY